MKGMKCPSCKKMIDMSTEICPHCNELIFYDVIVSEEIKEDKVSINNESAITNNVEDSFNHSINLEKEVIKESSVVVGDTRERVKGSPQSIAESVKVVSKSPQGIKTSPFRCGKRLDVYCISCSNSSNFCVLKNSPSVISRPSQSFFTRLTDTSLRRESSILYTLDGVIPARFANSLGVIFRSAQISRKRCTTASFTLIAFTSRKAYEKARECIYALAYFQKKIYNILEKYAAA